MTNIYLDWNATAPLSAAARTAWLTAQEEAWANPGSVHAFGQRARHGIDQAKATCARLLGVKPSEIIVTSGGTEANVLAIHTAVVECAARSVESAQVLNGNHPTILASAIDHSSILRNADAHANVVRLPVDHEGRLHSDTLRKALEELPQQPALVCLQFANNELGVRQDIAALVPVIRALAPQTRVLLDCAQGAGKARLDLRVLDVDFASIAGHKIGSPKGIGL